MLLRLALALLRSPLPRLVGTVIAVAASLALATAVLVVDSSIVTSIDRYVDAVLGRADVVVQAVNDDALSDDLIERIAAERAVDDAAGFLVKEVRVSGERANLFGADARFVALHSGPEAVPAPGEQAESPGIPIALSSALADSLGVNVGEQVVVAADGRETRFIFAARSGDLGLELLDREPAVFASSSTIAAGLGTEYAAPNRVLVKLLDGVPGGAEMLRTSLGFGFEVLERDQLTENALAGLRTTRQTLPLVAFIVMAVSGFVVFNTLATAALAHGRELSVVRAVGAGRRAIVGLAVAHAATVALPGFILGSAAGLWLARPLLDTLPPSLVSSAPTPIMVAGVAEAVGLSAGLGVLVIVAAAYLSTRPIIRTPVRASIDRDTATLTQRASAPSWWLGIALVMVTFGSIAAVLEPERMTVLAALLVIGGWATASRVFARRIGALMASLIARVNTSGWLSVGSGLSSRDRLSATSIVIGGALALVVGLQGTAVNTVRSALPTIAGIEQVDLLIQSVPVDELPTNRDLPGTLRTHLEVLPQVESASPIQMGYVLLGSRRVLVQGYAEHSALPLADAARKAGATLGAGVATITTQVASDAGLQKGDNVTLPQAGGDSIELTIGAVVDSFLWPNGVIGLDHADTSRLFGTMQASAFEISAQPQADKAAVRRDVESLTDGSSLHIFTGHDAVRAARSTIEESNRLFTLLGLLALLMAGIMTATSVAVETARKVRNYGTMRALGASRRTVIGIVLWEATGLATVGLALGVPLGLFIQYLTARVATVAQGLPVGFHWTAGPLLSAAAGLLIIVFASAIGPGRRMSQVPASEMLRARAS